MKSLTISRTAKTTPKRLKPLLPVPGKRLTELRRGTLEHSSSSDGPRNWRNSEGHDYFRAL